MTVNPSIKKKADDIRTKIYGKDVRESLASGLEEISKDVEETKGRQDEVETQFQSVIDNTTGKDVVSAPEILAARVSATGEQHNNLKERLDKEFNEVSAQLAQKANLSDLETTNENLLKEKNKVSKIQLYNYGGELGVRPNRHIAHRLNIPTYDGSGQAVHPDVIEIPKGFGSGKWKYWMVMTPYPNSNANYEDPSVLASHDKVNWVVPNGVTNPIVPTPPINNDHNSDGILVFDPDTNTLYMYYRETLKSKNPIEHRVFVKTTSDGENWTDSEQVLFDNSGRADAIMSPTVLKENGEWKMWLVDGWGNLVKKTSTNGRNWSTNIPTTTIGMPTGRNYWHIDVERNGGRLEMLLCSSTGSGGADARLHHAYSLDDGHTWYVTEGYFINKVYDFEGSLHYRASILRAEGNLFDIYYSAMSKNNVWSIIYMKAIFINDTLIPLYPSDYRNEVKIQDLRGKGAWIITDSVVTLSHQTQLAIPFRTPVYDDLGFRTLAYPSRITIPPKVKKVRINAGAVFASNGTGIRRLFISKNGSTTASGMVAMSTVPANNITNEVQVMSPVLNVVAGDYFEVYAYQNSGGNLNIERVNGTFVSVEVIE